MTLPMDIASGLVSACWLVFFAVWAVAAGFVRQNKRTQGSAARILQSALYVAGALLLLGPGWLPLGPLRTPFVPASLATATLSAGLTAVGIGFAVWARATLGRNWSGRVTLKEGHELIEDGPYALVRHPIYTGLLTAFLGTAVLRGTPAAFLAFGLFAVTFGTKIAAEERFLTAEFGTAFDSYRQRVKALVPFVF